MRTYICISLLFTGLIGLGLCHIKMTPLRLLDPESVEIECPDGGRCADNSTCCKTSDTRYGCCPHPDAVCCNDMKHCCPSGTTCDLTKGTCDRVVEVKEVVCPGGASQCPDKSTCCLVADGKYGCCPSEKAVCCSDKKHCCPNGFTCSKESNHCEKEQLNIASWW